MISQVLVILGLLALYILSIIALYFAGMSAGKTGMPRKLPSGEDDDGEIKIR